MQAANGMVVQPFSQSTQSAAPSSAAVAAGTLPPALLSAAGGENVESHIHIVPDSINDQILVQCTAQEFEEIKQTLHDLDVVPRQVMIEAKVFEVDLNGALSAG
jgi:general secretion pathway protein D